MDTTDKYQTITKFFKLYCTLATSFLLALFIASTFFPVEDSGALTCTNGSVTDPDSTSASIGYVCNSASSDVSVTVENPYYISVTSSAGSGSGIILDYSSSSGNKLGTVVTATDTVTTTSNTGKIKHLYISTTSSSNNLTNSKTDLENNKTYIGAGGGDTLAGATSLTDNTWGFNIENNNNFTKVPTLGNEILLQEEIGTENTETGEYESAQNITYGVLATTDLYAGSYSNTIKYTAFTTEPPYETRTLNDITYMQEATTAICENTPKADTSGNNIFTLKDSRDKKDYKVAHLADGNCWMMQDLSYDGGILSPDSSDVTSEHNLSNAIITSGTISKYDEPQIIKSRVNSATNLYNWNAATAGVGKQEDLDTVVESVCPKGFILPDSTGQTSYVNLLQSYGYAAVISKGSATVISALQQAPLLFNRTGWYNGGFYYSQNGTYWMRTPSGENTAYQFYFNVDYNVYNTALAGGNSNETKQCARAVRCVLGE